MSLLGFFCVRSGFARRRCLLRPLVERRRGHLRLALLPSNLHVQNRAHRRILRRHISQRNVFSQRRRRRAARHLADARANLLAGESTVLAFSDQTISSASFTLGKKIEHPTDNPPTPITT